MENVPNLQTLNLSDNNLKDLSTEITKVSKLTALDLSENEFEHAPSILGELTMLKALRISNNKLKSLSDELTKLSSGFENLSIIY